MLNFNRYAIYNITEENILLEEQQWAKIRFIKENADEVWA